MSAGQPGSPARLHGSPAREPHGLLPAWPSVLAVVAHPDDETFGLGAVVDQLATSSAAVHVLCFTRGEASTLNENGADLRHAREQECSGQAGRELGVAQRHAARLRRQSASRVCPGPPSWPGRSPGWWLDTHAAGLLVFDDTGITGHADHQAATRAAVQAADK